MTWKALFLISVSVHLLIGCSETTESKYVSFDKAKELGAIDSGWVPGIVPETTGEIIESHNIDTNQQILRFSYDPEIAEKLSISCKNISPREVRWPDLTAKWWPTQLTTGLTTHSEVFFWCKESNGFVATNYQEYVYFWRN